MSVRPDWFRFSYVKHLDVRTQGLGRTGEGPTHWTPFTESERPGVKGLSQCPHYCTHDRTLHESLHEPRIIPSLDTNNNDTGKGGRKDDTHTTSWKNTDYTLTTTSI